MAYGVGTDYRHGEVMDPPEVPSGHYEYDYDADLGRSVRYWASDEEEEDGEA